MPARPCRFAGTKAATSRFRRDDRAVGRRAWPSVTAPCDSPAPMSSIQAVLLALGVPRDVPRHETLQGFRLEVEPVVLDRHFFGPEPAFVQSQRVGLVHGNPSCFGFAALEALAKNVPT